MFLDDCAQNTDRIAFGNKHQYFMGLSCIKSDPFYHDVFASEPFEDLLMQESGIFGKDMDCFFRDGMSRLRPVT
jgi:hypothetical protein